MDNHANQQPWWVPSVQLDEEAAANLAAIIARNDAARERAGLTEQEAAALNLEAARRALRSRRDSDNEVKPQR